VKLNFPAQMIERSLWALWWLLLLGASFWLMVGSVSYWIRHGYLPADASGWVQAMGAIVAIGVAVVIPLYQRAHEQAVRTQERVGLEIARSEQLFSLCTEAKELICGFDSEALYADYNVTNAMRRAVLGDLLIRLNEAQLTELSAERLRIGMALRFQLFDWLQYFGGDAEVNVGRLHDRVEQFGARLTLMELDANNHVRLLKGLPPIDAPVPANSEDDFPF
jgi:hypothetical protein